MTPPRDPDPIAPLDGAVDHAREERQARSAWSMVAAVALHAAALVSWPTARALVPDLQATLDPSAVESAQPEWLFMDQAIASAPKEGDGGAAKPRQGSNGEGVRRGIHTVDPDPVPEGISPDLRDQLVRSTSFAPTIADDGTSRGSGGKSTEDAGAALRGAGMAGLTDADHQSLDELSALDLERLAAVRPEVALEASSAWVLVRNPGQVKDFILQHATDNRDRPKPAAASVAIYISAAGSVEWAEVIASSGRSDWDDLALKLFNDVVTFRPARLQGVPTPMSAVFTVDFPW
jgi:hypothetical protein